MTAHPESALAEFLLHAQAVVENALADAQILRRDLQQLVLGEIFQTVLKAHVLRRDQPQCIVAAAGAGIRQMLALADIDDDILRLRGTADDHALIDLRTCRNEQAAALLRVVKAVGHGFTGLIGDQRADSTALDLTLVGLIMELE